MLIKHVNKSRIQVLLKERKQNLMIVNVYILIQTLDHVFYTNTIACCEQIRYVRLAIYTDLFTLIC